MPNRVEKPGVDPGKKLPPNNDLPSKEEIEAAPRDEYVELSAKPSISVGAPRKQGRRVVNENGGISENPKTFSVNVIKENGIGPEIDKKLEEISEDAIMLAEAYRVSHLSIERRLKNSLEKLINISQIQYAVQLSDQEGITVTSVRDDYHTKTLFVGIDISMENYQLICEKLNAEALAYLLANTGLRMLYATELANPSFNGKRGEQLSLYKRFLAFERRLETDNNPALRRLKIALKMFTVPDDFASVLSNAGISDSDINIILHEMRRRKRRFDIHSQDIKLPRQDFYNVRTSEMGVYFVDARRDVYDSLTERDVYLLFANFIIYHEKLGRSSFFRYHLFKRIDLIPHIVIYKTSSADLSSAEYIGTWDKGWVGKITETLKNINYLADLLLSFSFNVLSDGAKNMVHFLSSASIAEFVLVLDPEINAVEIEIEKEDRNDYRLENLRRRVIVRLPARRYTSIRAQDVLAAIVKKTEIGGGEIPEEIIGFSRLVKVYDAQIKKGENGIQIRGNARYTDMKNIADALNALWKGSTVERLGLEGEVVRKMISEKTIIAVTRIIRPVKEEKKGPQRKNRIVLLPAEKGFLILIDGDGKYSPSVNDFFRMFASAHLDPDSAVIISSKEIDSTRELLDFIDRVEGRKVSGSFGAEKNPVWAGTADVQKRGEYVMTLRWFDLNKDRIPPELFPHPYEDKFTIGMKYREFSREFHSDVNPRDVTLFRDGNRHYKLMRDMAPETAATAPAPRNHPIVVTRPNRHTSTGAVQVVVKARVMRLKSLLEKEGYSWPEIESELTNLALALRTSPEKFINEVQHARGFGFRLIENAVGEDMSRQLAERIGLEKRRSVILRRRERDREIRKDPVK